jgi:tetratricopeptide (TPR) repeat protein
VRRRHDGGSSGARAAFALALLAVSLSSGSGRADEKKKPGLFDFEGWKTPVQRQRDSAKTLAPGRLDLEPLGRFDTPPRAVRVRVYADRDYRGGVLHWREKARSQIERVSNVVEAVFNVRFEIESLREWDETHAGAELPALAEALDALDGARDVDWVVGFVTPFRGVATSAHQIGSARLMSRSFVMRAMDDEEEGRALEREFTMLSGDEREKLYGDRKAHKEIVIFLHEWAHTMGALHLEQAEMIMNAAYDPRQTAFSDFEKRLIGLVLEARLGDRAHPFPESTKALGLVEKSPPDEGSNKDRAELAQLLRGRAPGGPPNPATSVRSNASSGSASPAVAAQSEEARAAHAAIERAMARLRDDDLAGAAPLVLEAAQEARTATIDPPTLLKIASAAGAVGALSTADAVLARVDRDARPPRLITELEAARYRVALPRAAAKLGVTPEDEPRYVAAFWLASRAVASRNFAAAERRLAELTEAFPESAGREVVACELAVASKRLAEAAARCESALAKDPTAVRAHLAYGRLAARRQRNLDAEKHFRRVILLDPSDDDAWRELGQLYLAMHASTQHAELAREHETILSTPLPD